MRAAPRARFDDLRAGRAYELHDVGATGTAWHHDQVAALLAAASDQAAAGRWVALVLAYEAGSAFEPSMPRRVPDPPSPLAWYAAFAERRAVAPVRPPTEPPRLRDRGRLGGSAWFRTGVQACRDLIEAGEVYQVNLTDRVRARLDGDPFELYRAMATAQVGSYNAYLELGDLTVVSASPELFLRLDDGAEDDDGLLAVTRPMKGTARRHPRPEQDARVARELVGSEKERAENVMIVDLLRNDLSRLARPGGVTVPTLFDAERYETVWQLTSTVRAELRAGVSLEDVVAATFPCGSVTGAPKIAAMRAIHDLEPWSRGVYCGAIGLIEPGPRRSPRATFSVAIRTATVEPDGAVTFGTGAGITWGSDPVREDVEVDAKRAVLTAHRPDVELLETLRVEQARAIHLDEHLARLTESAAYFGFAHDPGAVRRACCEAIDATPDTRATPHRMRILLGREGRVRVELHPVDAAPPGPVRLAVAPRAVRSDDVYCCHKTTHRAHYERAAALHPDADDVVLGNERDEVVETCRANLLYRIGARWFTPPLTSGGLPGVGRGLLVRSGEIQERLLHLEELDEVDELMVVSSLRGRRAAVIGPGGTTPPGPR